MNIWGNNVIRLLDTTFWTSLSTKPKKFNKKFRERVNLLECDYAVMPMFSLY